MDHGSGGLMGEPLSRREALVRGAGLAAALGMGGVTLASAASALGRSAGGKAGRGVTVVLPDYPFFPGTLMEEAPELLDSLARTYVKGEGNEDAVMTRFLFSYVPVTMFDRIYDAKSPAATLPMGGVLWLFHLSGYFGGVWLRDELVRTGKNPAISGYSDPQDEAGFVALVGKAQARLDAATGRRHEVLEANEASLYDIPSETPGEA